MILPLKIIENVGKEKGFLFGYSGLVIVVRGREELFFEFNQLEARDDCAVMLLKNIESSRELLASGPDGNFFADDGQRTFLMPEHVPRPSYESRRSDVEPCKSIL